MSADAQPNPKQRANVAYPPEPPIGLPARDKATVGALCVVCGDRACSHLYYGVAACHGCKCFFWRTVKSGLTYSCRFDGRCSISTAGRNACRYCRFNRCLKSGMKLEAVRMDRKNDKALKRKRSEVDSDEFDENQENIETPAIKKQRTDHRLLTSSLMLIDRTASDGNGKMALSRSFVSLAMVMEEPEILDGDRTEMSFRACAQADEVACAESERRLLTWAIDWTRQVADMEDAISNNDKIALLRACCVPLTLLELGARSCVTAAQSKSSCAALHVLPLPNNTYLRTDAQLPQNWYCSFLSLSFSVTHLLIKFSFLTANSIRGLLEWTTRHLKQLQLSPKELVLLKALIVANVDAPGLSPSAESAVSALRDRVHSALYQHCADVCEPSKAAGRLAKILLLLPQLYLLSTEVVEHQRMRHTFALPYQLNPLLVQLFGDIFEEGKTDEPYLMSGTGLHSLPRRPVGRRSALCGRPCTPLMLPQ
ncbi:hypothetical protein Y032_0043g761 [Ancylostoma ceylanicum]|uniref:Zinc finger, C4 type n=1 Tax=Ancylostoma ceylanicum TaxID=53326 RepID=A0A016UF52_9BILA|nr:hypothetical protein Y032_0043g761 [Ancylostoma ceylanicum]